VAHQPAHPTGSEHAVALAAVDVGVFQRVGPGSDRFLLDGLGAVLDGFAVAFAGTDDGLDLVAAGVKAVGLAVKDALRRSLS